MENVELSISIKLLNDDQKYASCSLLLKNFVASFVVIEVDVNFDKKNRKISVG